MAWKNPNVGMGIVIILYVLPWPATTVTSRVEQSERWKTLYRGVGGGTGTYLHPIWSTPNRYRAAESIQI